MFTKEEMKDITVTTGKSDDKKFNKMIEQVPLRIIDARTELDYYTNPDPTMADHLHFLQRIINSSRILMKSNKLMKLAEELFKQGFLFRHQPKAIEAKATKYSRAEEKMRDEIKASCGSSDHTSCDY